MAAVGGALFLAGGFLFVVLLAIDITASTGNPYRALVTHIAAPAIVTLGFVLFLISAWLQIRAARRKGERVRFRFSIDPSDPRYLRNLWLFLGLCAVLLLVIAYSGTRAYEATDSAAFCGEVCHEVMEPQAVTYRKSPHARVPCVECHIGPGASFYVKSKIDGLRQVMATARNSFSRPIHTPIQDLRPAKETCEGCHWPEQFYGNKLISKTYYRTDEENSPWTINLVLKIGGGNPRTGRQGGIHWHTLTENRIEYVATDEKRQTIPWIRQITLAGDTIIYRDPDAEEPDFTDPVTAIRLLDCMDCHNRPSHQFTPPAVAMNEALRSRRISPDLPSIRQVGLDLLNAEYERKDEALAAIDAGLRSFYQTEYPDRLAGLEAPINQAIVSLQEIYRNNFFPAMKTDYRVRENNLSHFVNDGCFRCHDGVKESEDGRMLATDCHTCHDIVAQGPSEELGDLEADLEGLPFHHPEDIDGMWQEMKCTDCHTPDSGY